MTLILVLIGLVCMIYGIGRLATTSSVTAPEGFATTHTIIASFGVLVEMVAVLQLMQNQIQ